MGKVVELKTDDELLERKKVVARMLLLSFLIDRWTETNFFDQEAHDEEGQIGADMIEDGVLSMVEQYGDDILEIEDQMLTVKEELRKWMIAMDDHA